jgi:hypothetical protein
MHRGPFGETTSKPSKSHISGSLRGRISWFDNMQHMGLILLSWDTSILVLIIIIEGLFGGGRAYVILNLL